MSSIFRIIESFFLDDEECVECDSILEQLENIDDEADEFGINFVKNKDPHAARQNIYFSIFIVIFRPSFCGGFDLGDFYKNFCIAERCNEIDRFFDDPHAARQTK
jgi:hypothetical protein